MGLRRVVLSEGEFYHVYNHASHNLQLFSTNQSYGQFLEAVNFYVQSRPLVRFSIYKKSRNSHPIDLLDPLVRVICFCLMPNHYHFVLKQEKNEGIRKFIQRLCNSYSHYYNKKNKSGGSLFKGNFRAVRIENNEQLLHLSRYIHLNPVTDYFVEKPEDWHFSSYCDYVGNGRFDFIEPDVILDQFSEKKDYQKFVLSRKDFQRKLGVIKKLLIDN